MRQIWTRSKNPPEEGKFGEYIRNFVRRRNDVVCDERSGRWRRGCLCMMWRIKGLGSKEQTFSEKKNRWFDLAHREHIMRT